jgi:hypothetical protein
MAPNPVAKEQSERENEEERENIIRLAKPKRLTDIGVGDSGRGSQGFRTALKKRNAAGTEAPQSPTTTAKHAAPRSLV